MNVMNASDVFSYDVNHSMSIFLNDLYGNRTDRRWEHLLDQLDFWTEGVLLLVICLLGVIGNIVSIMVLTSKDIDLKPSFANILICLAVYDLLFGIFAVFLYSLPSLSLYYKFFCLPYVAPYLLGLIHVSLTGSVYTTIAVAVERCVTVCAPFSSAKMSRGMFYIIPIVIFSFLYNITKFFEVKTVPAKYIFNNGTHITDSIPPTMDKSDLKGNSAYIASSLIANCVVMGLIPMILLSLLNYLIYNAVSRATARHNAIASNGNGHRRDSTMAALLTGIVLVFLVCHSLKAAINIYETIQVLRFGDSDQYWNWILEVSSIFSHLMIAINSSINIVIYSFKDFKFRQVLKAYLCGKSAETVRTGRSHYRRRISSSRMDAGKVQEMSMDNNGINGNNAMNGRDKDTITITTCCSTL